MVDSNDFFGKYLKAEDVDAQGTIQVEIEAVRAEEVGRDKEQMLAVYFKGLRRGLILNATNHRAIKNITGTKDTDDWIGHKMELFCIDTTVAQEAKRGIRIRPVA